MNHLLEKKIIFNLGPVFRGLRIIISLLILLLSAQAVYDILAVRTFKYKSTTEPKPQDELRRDRPAKKDLSAYLEPLNRGMIFGLPQSGDSGMIPLQAKGGNLKALLTNYEIQGIIWGETPKAIIFEKAKKETITAGVNDSLGQIVITAIYNDHITFQLFEETYDVKY